jgi:hypothetical protein
MDGPIVPPFTPDPDTLRRQMKLLQIEVEQLRAVEQMLRAELERCLDSGEAHERKAKEFLRAYVEEVEQLRESRDYWEQKALRLSVLKPHVWFEWCLIRGGDLLKRVLRRFKCWWPHQRRQTTSDQRL